RRAEAVLYPGSDQARDLLRAWLHGAARGRRPRVVAVPRCARWRRIRHQWAEDVHLRCPCGDAHLSDGPDQSEPAEASRHLDLPVPDGYARDHGAAIVDHAERSDGANWHHLWPPAHQRNVL